jgi:rod shape-determining protein MreD
MRRALAAVAAVLVTVTLQVTVVNGLPWPGGAPPDLVLLLVVALGLVGGPVPGALAGFGAGLAADVAPPASHLVGLSALVFCLVGYGCGRLREPLEEASWLPLAVVVAGAAAGEVLYALAGMTFGDPDITWQSVRMVLPPALLYEILLSPFLLFAVTRLAHWAGLEARRRPAAGLLTGRELVSPGLVAALAGEGLAVRDTGSGQVRLKLAGGRRAGPWAGGQQARNWVRQPAASRIRLRAGVAGSAARGPAQAPVRRPAAARLRLGSPRRHDGVSGIRWLGLAAAGRAVLGGWDGRGSGRPAAIRGAAFSGGRSTLGAGQAGRSREVRLRLGTRQPARPHPPARPGAAPKFRAAGGGGGAVPRFRSARPAAASPRLRASGGRSGAIPRFRLARRAGPAPRFRASGGRSGAIPRFRTYRGGGAAPRFRGPDSSRWRKWVAAVARRLAVPRRLAVSRPGRLRKGGWP